MPINTDLNTAPYFDDYDVEKQYYKILFKPGFAVQAREMTQLQTMLQNQVEQFGDNIFKEGSIVKGCNFSTLDGLSFVKVGDLLGFDPTSYISRRVTEEFPVGSGIFIEVDYLYELEGDASKIKANIISATRGFETRPPDLNTFFVHYINSAGNSDKVFAPGEQLNVNLYKFKVGDEAIAISQELNIAQINVTTITSTPEPHTGPAYGIQSAPGVIFQKGHFLFADEQTLIVSKYTNIPNDLSVGYSVKETLKTSLQDNSLYDNANSAPNQNAPGADRLELIPILTVFETPAGDVDPTFFALIRYQNGNEVTLRDVSQYNVLGEEMARRTYEESGNYILKDFKVKTDRRDGDVQVLVGTGAAYVKGYRVENSAERAFVIDQIDPTTGTDIQSSQPTTFNYGQYVDVINFQGILGLNSERLDILAPDGSSVLGTCFASNLTGAVGTGIGKLYLYGVRMTGTNRFSSAWYIDSPANVGNGRIQIGDANVNPVLRQTNKGPLVFDTGMFSLKEITGTVLPVRTVSQATPANDNGTDVITIADGNDEDFALDNSDIVVIDATSTFMAVSSVTVNSGTGDLEISLAGSPGASANPVTVYYNKNILGSSGAGQEPYLKESRDTFVKFSYATSETKYSLGFPDVYEIISILDVDDNEYSSSFRLVSNQKDFYYDRSYVEHIQGRPIPPVGELRVALKVYQPNPSTGGYFFNITSYDNALPESSIPVYTATNGEQYNLRECFDFRPYVDKDSAASYTAVDIASAPNISQSLGVNVSPTFADLGVALTPSVNQSARSDLEYYRTRVDLIIANSYGEINLIKGTEAQFALPPKIDSDSIVISEVKVPGYPALSSQEASDQQRREYAVKARPVGTKNYTMKDIGSLESKIERLEYYVSLSQLESETANLTVLDQDGLSRFKNGFLADPFNDLTLANIRDPQFNSAVSSSSKKLTPSIKTFPIDLIYKAGSGVSVFPTADIKGNVATLLRDSDVSLISQPFASEFRNCVSNFYKYNGEGTVSPPYDASYDTTTNPVTLDIDLTSAFDDLVDNLQQFVPLTDISRTTIVANETWDPETFRARGRPINVGGWQQTRQEQTTTRNLTVTPSTTENMVGDFVTDFRFQPYMASRDIKVYMTGLRPNTRHYFFFDGVDVNANIYPGSMVNDTNLISRFGLKGAEVKSDFNGTLRVVFNIPAETFFVGDRVLDVVDVDQFASIESASTSRGFITYRAYSFSVEKAALTTSTRAPDFDIAATTTTRNLPRRATGGRDPLAQTFFIKQGMGAGSNSVFLSKVDVFFKRKAESVTFQVPDGTGGFDPVVNEGNGVTVMIREVINGYPSNQIVPFSKVHYTPTQVSVSDNASVATTFTFPAPVRLDVEKEYAVVIQPDASDPNYLVFTSKVGGVDLTPGPTNGTSIVQDWGDGVLFTSTNNRAWKSYQDEDVKFNLYRHDFNVAGGTGNVTLTNNRNEFFTVNDITGRFQAGELIYQLKGAYASAAIPLNSNVLSLNNVSTLYNIGDEILIRDAGQTRKDIFKILTLNANTAILDRTSSYNVVGGSGAPIVTGSLCYYDKNNPTEMHLESSTAKPSRIFTSETIIIGLDSGFQANLVSIDDIQLSYIQPMIMKANDSVSVTAMMGSFLNPANNSYELPMRFGDNNHFNKDGVLLYSRSNDASGARDFDININMSNGSNRTSTPFIDIESSKLIAYQYKVTNDSATTGKFISKTIELAEDLDAEDMNVIVTGYRPINTDIKVYIKPQNVFDSDDFASLEWIELELFEGTGTFSSTINVNDYKEFKYRVADVDKVDDAVTYTSTAGTFEGFRRFAIRIDMLSTNIYNVPTLKDYRAIALT